ncbi:MAG TPA: Maf family protein [Propioniciclava sp.]|uniref:Maf family protein n=1 Tax=Propioniciclava sp. TaxID=2038686 RepID=UPI002C87D7F3|nr:Maf family protein [Propioniciclava sp.]HRL49437.1 Maf family protein [Propioniciclava sp.]
MDVVLASSSPARLRELRAAGLAPRVVVSGIDEGAVTAPTPRALALTLARLKGDASLATLDPNADLVLLACDSVLDLDGVAVGKPGTDQAVRERWRSLRNRDAFLTTGHYVVVRRDGVARTASAAATTRVRFANVSDEEIEAYIATGEPHQVAGGFTIDGYGAAFITGLGGDPHNVVGISIPLLRSLLADLGVAWTSLWQVPGR